jgi:hypothetical protein
MASITVYKDTNFNGQSLTFPYPVDNLVTIGNFNDQTSSCRIASGTWILYEDTEYQGHSSILGPGSYSSAEGMGIANDSLSSLRAFPEVDPSLPLILLFKDTEFHGVMILATGPISDLRAYDFSDVLSSVIVVRGTWTLYKDVSFGGSAYTVSATGGTNGDGRYPEPSPFPNDAISSLRPAG